MILLKLFFEFFKIGLFAVGGGAATIPFLSALSDATGWFTKLDLANMIAISESTPGAIGVNMSTYAGFMTGDGLPMQILGAVIASLGLVFPSVVVIIIIATLLEKFKENKIVKDVFYGLRPASAGLIAAAAFEIAKISLLHIDVFTKSGVISDLFDLKNIALFVVLFVAIKKIKIHPIFYILISALIGIIFQF